MVAPSSKIELLSIKKAHKMSVDEIVKLAEKRKELLAANKVAARTLLLGISFATIEKSAVDK